MHVELVIDMSRTMSNTGSLAVSFVTAVALATLVLFFVRGTLNPQSFAIGCVVVMIVAAIVWTLLLKHPNAPVHASGTTTASSVQRSNRRKYVRVALLVLLLGVSFWITRGGPWAPRLIGASVLVLFAIGTILQKPK